MKKNDFVFNAALNTLTITADFAKKASNVNSKEYRKLVELRRNNPSLIVKQRTHEGSSRLTYKDMEVRLHRIDKNGNLIEAFKLVKEIAKTEEAPYAYVYNWYKAQMKAVEAEKENEKKVSASNAEELKKKLAELTAGISFDASVEVEEDAEVEEGFELEEAI